MALLDDKKKKLAAAGQPVTSTAPALASAAQAQTSAPAATATPKSSGYTNLQDYLRLNQPQAQAMAQKAAGGIQQEGAQFQGALNNANQQFTQQVANGSPFGTGSAPGRGIMDRPGNAGGIAVPQVQPTPPKTHQVGPYTPPKMPIPPETLNPTLAQQQISQLGTLGQKQYSGPTGYTTDQIASLGAQGQKLSTDANQLTSYNGLQAYLQQQNQGAGYTPGESRLDAFLTGAAGHGAFGQLAKQYGDTGASVGKAAQSASDFAKSAADYNNSLAAGYAQQAKQAQDALNKQTQDQQNARTDSTADAANRSGRSRRPGYSGLNDFGGG